MWWLIDAIVLLVAFAISPVVGFAWLIINVAFVVVRAITLSTQAQMLQRQAHWEHENRVLSEKEQLMLLGISEESADELLTSRQR